MSNRHSAPRQRLQSIDALGIIAELRAGKMSKAADLVEQTVYETLTYYAFPDIHWQKIRTNNPLERIMRDACRGLVESAAEYLPEASWQTISHCWPAASSRA